MVYPYTKNNRPRGAILASMWTKCITKKLNKYKNTFFNSLKYIMKVVKRDVKCNKNGRKTVKLI